MYETQFQFAKRRDFGDVVGDGIQFIIKNFKSFFTGFLMYVGPFFLIAAFAQTQMMTPFVFDPTGEQFPIQFSTGLVVYFLALMAASVMLMSFTYAVIQKFQDFPEERIIDGIWPYIQKNIGRVVIAVLGITAIFLISGILVFSLASIGGVGFFLLIFMTGLFLFVYLWVPLLMVPFVYANEGVDFVSAVRRSFYLIKNQWWSTFAIFLVIGIVSLIVSSIFSIPAYIITFSQTLGSGGDFTQIPQSPTYYVFNSLGILGSMFVAIYQFMGVALQYYSLRELKDGTGLMERIEQIDEEDPD